MNKPPDAETRDDIERAMGEIGEPADPVNQSETNGHQSERETIDDSVDENIHAWLPNGSGQTLFAMKLYYFFIQGGSLTSPMAILGGKTTILFPACHWNIVPTAPSFGSTLGITW